MLLKKILLIIIYKHDLEKVFQSPWPGEELPPLHFKGSGWGGECLPPPDSHTQYATDANGSNM